MALTATAGSDSKRAIIVVIVALLHVGGYYIIESGLSHQIVSMLSKPIETVMVDEVKPPEDLPPPPPPPDIVEPPPFIPPPEIAVMVQSAATNAIQVVTNERPPVVAPPPVAPPAPVEVPLVKGGFDPKRPVRSTDEFYPSASIRAGEEGVTVVEIYIAADGRVTDARIKTSSGFERLDEATLKYVKTWRMKPATRGGVPEGSWVSVPVRWKIETK